MNQYNHWYNACKTLTWFSFSNILTTGKNFTGFNDFCFTAKKTFKCHTNLFLSNVFIHVSLWPDVVEDYLETIKKKIMIVLKSLHTFDKSICFDVCVCVSVHRCVLCLYVSVSNNASLTLWLGISHCLCVHLDSMAGERADWPCDLSVWDSCQWVNERRLFRARRASAKWPGRMTTLCSDPYVSLRPSVKQPPPTSQAMCLLPPPPRVKPGHRT